MNPIVFLLLAASGALAEVTECADGSTRPMAAPTQPTARGAQVSPDQTTILRRPVATEEFSSEASHTKPLKSVCLMKVNCLDSGAIDNEELQRDEEFQDVPSTAESTTTQTSTAGSPKPTRPPLPCTVDIWEVRSYAGHCVRLGQHFGGCRAGPYVSPMEPPCHPPPQH